MKFFKDFISEVLNLPKKKRQDNCEGNNTKRSIQSMKTKPGSLCTPVLTVVHSSKPAPGQSALC